MEACILTGIDITEGIPKDYPIKKMCLNCIDCIKDEETGAYKCKNESIMNMKREEIIKALPEGVEIDVLTLKPYLLKSPTKKCGMHTADIERIVNTISEFFEK